MKAHSPRYPRWVSLCTSAEIPKVLIGARDKADSLTKDFVENTPSEPYFKHTLFQKSIKIDIVKNFFLNEPIFGKLFFFKPVFNFKLGFLYGTGSMH